MSFVQCLKTKGFTALHVIWIESFVKFTYVRAHVPVSQVTVIIQYLENCASVVLPLPADF